MKSWGILARIAKGGTSSRRMLLVNTPILWLHRIKTDGYLVPRICERTNVSVATGVS